ncbi:MAG: 2'-5' RNA ligase family protein [Comamonadaceae bacterium]|nr:2'-5' RNA ligase family protein [Comamonadaceae bacterium]
MRMPSQQPPASGAAPAAAPLQHHLFFAVLPDAAALHAASDLAQSLIVRHDLQAQVRAPRLHATLLSLGWEDQLSESHLAWARAAAARVRAPSFELRFDHVLSFPRAPRAKRPCVLCAPAEPQLGFLRLYEALHAALWSQVPDLQDLQDLPRAPHITPHMTLCYSRQSVPEQAVAPLAWTVQSFALLHNRHGSSGPYELLGQWPLE